MRDRIRVGSATEPIDGRYDLVTCIEVLEHLAPQDAERAIDRMCAVTDTVLFSSSPADFDDPTHINVRPTADWAAAFAERGFFRRTDVNLDFLAPLGGALAAAPSWRRATSSTATRAQYAALHAEVVEKRAALLESHREIARLHSAAGGAEDYARLQDEMIALNARARELERQTVKAQHEVLTTRDHIIGLEARADELSTRLSAHKARLKKQSDKADDLQVRLNRQRRRADDNQRQIDELKGSRAWRIGRMFTRPFRGSAR